MQPYARPGLWHGCISRHHFVRVFNPIWANKLVYYLVSVWILHVGTVQCAGAWRHLSVRSNSWRPDLIAGDYGGCQGSKEFFGRAGLFQIYAEIQSQQQFNVYFASNSGRNIRKQWSLLCVTVEKLIFLKLLIVHVICCITDNRLLQSNYSLWHADKFDSIKAKINVNYLIHAAGREQNWKVSLNAFLKGFPYCL